MSPVPPGETTASIRRMVASHETPAMLTRVKNGPLARFPATVLLLVASPVQPPLCSSTLGFIPPMKAIWMRM